MATDTSFTNRLSDTSQMMKDIRVQNRVPSVLRSLTSGKVVHFNLNPNYVDEINVPVQSVVPTAGNFHVYRWMNEPTRWKIQGYAGLDGKNLAKQLEDFMGETQANWHFPYLGADKIVRIDQISLPKRSDNPFSVYYSVDMQELVPKLNLSLISQVIPNRITPGFVSPNSIAQSLILSASAIGSVPVLPTWTNMDQAALFIFQNKLSNLPASELASKMRNGSFNNISPEPWPAGKPFDSLQGVIVQDLRFPITNSSNGN